jgi:hypothetical protein
MLPSTRRVIFTLMACQARVLACQARVLACQARVVACQARVVACIVPITWHPLSSIVACIVPITWHPLSSIVACLVKRMSWLAFCPCRGMPCQAQVLAIAPKCPVTSTSRAMSCLAR